MEISEVTEGLRGCAAKYADMSIEARHGKNIDWGRVSLFGQFSDLLERLADEIEEDIMLHFDPKEAPDTQEKLEADVEEWANDRFMDVGGAILDINEFLRRQRELDEKNNR